VNDYATDKINAQERLGFIYEEENDQNPTLF